MVFYFSMIFYSLVQFHFFFFFLVLLPWFLIPNQKIIIKTNAKKLIVCIFFKEFYTFRSYVHAFIDFELIFCIVKNRAPVSLSCTCLSSFPNTIYWRECPILTIYIWLLYYKLISHICMGLFLRLLFGCNYLYFCVFTNTILFWLL